MFPLAGASRAHPRLGSARAEASLPLMVFPFDSAPVSSNTVNTKIRAEGALRQQRSLACFPQLLFWRSPLPT